MKKLQIPLVCVMTAFFLQAYVVVEKKNDNTLTRWLEKVSFDPLDRDYNQQSVDDFLTLTSFKRITELRQSLIKKMKPSAKFIKKSSANTKEATEFYYNMIEYNSGSTFLDANLQLSVNGTQLIEEFYSGSGSASIDAYDPYLEISCPVFLQWPSSGRMSLIVDEYDNGVFVSEHYQVWYLDQYTTPTTNLQYASYIEFNNEFYVYLQSFPY